MDILQQFPFASIGLNLLNHDYATISNSAGIQTLLSLSSGPQVGFSAELEQLIWNCNRAGRERLDGKEKKNRKERKLASIGLWKLFLRLAQTLTQTLTLTLVKFTATLLNRARPLMAKLNRCLAQSATFRPNQESCYVVAPVRSDLAQACSACWTTERG